MGSKLCAKMLSELCGLCERKNSAASYLCVISSGEVTIKFLDRTSFLLIKSYHLIPQNAMNIAKARKLRLAKRSVTSFPSHISHTGGRKVGGMGWALACCERNSLAALG